MPTPSGPASPTTEVAIDLTTEVRWFFDDRLPPEVLSWFTNDGVGFAEDRSDTYRLDGQVDIGLKRRARRTLELKLRLQPPERYVGDHGLEGRLETWQRWSPADGHIYLNSNMIWVDIDKHVFKRRFDPSGQEVPLSKENRATTGEGCDVEIATLSVCGRRAWTFAFAAFGEPDSHRHHLEASWEALVGGRSRPSRLRLDGDNSFGYPEWMTRSVPLLRRPGAVIELAARSGRG